MFVDNVIYSSLFCISLLVFQNVSCDKIKYIASDIGTNITIPCPANSQLTNNVENKYAWIFQGMQKLDNHTIESDGSLFIQSLTRNDTGNYSCVLEDKTNVTTEREIVSLFVRSPPLPLNVSLHLSTILGLVLWKVVEGGDGGYPIIHFTAEYRSAILLPDNETEEYKLEPWRPISPNHITPNARQIDVYHLNPNSSYWFRVWANNTLGASIPVEVLGRTLFSDTNAQLRRHFLTGIEEFDTRVWVIAVGIVMGTLCLLTTGTCLLLYKECKTANDEDQDVMELVPNIILNPGFVESQTIIGTAPCAVVVRSDGKKRQANGTAQPRKV